MLNTTNNILANLTLCLIVGLGACSSESGDDVDTTVRGVCAYDDDATGEPARPQAQPMTVEIRVEGTGQIDGLDPECTVDGATGAFNGRYAGEAHVDEAGGYVAGMSSTTATFETLSGCAIPELNIGAVTDVVVRATLAADAPNCDGYCAARARSYAETECGAGTGEATCRAQAESDYEATCSAACTGQTTYRIVAETSLSADAVAALNASSITGAALGDIDVDLTFDRVETAEGSVVEEQ